MGQAYTRKGCHYDIREATVLEGKGTNASGVPWLPGKGPRGDCKGKTHVMRMDWFSRSAAKKGKRRKKVR